MRHLHRWKVRYTDFVVYSKSRFLSRPIFLRCLDTYLCTWGWIYEQSLICYFFNVVLVYCPPVQIGGTEGVTGHDRGRNFKKIGVQHDGKNFFARFFWKNFFARIYCFRYFIKKKEKKLPPKFFWKKGLTWDAPRCTIETLQEGRPKDTRCAVYGIRFERSNV